MSDAQDRAEALDDDKLDDVDDYEGEGSSYEPPDGPLAVDGYGITDREAALDEPMDERDRRYRPDRLPPSDEPVLLLIDDGDADVETADFAMERRADDLPAEEAAMHVIPEPG